jgi:hypothetical protein
MFFMAFSAKLAGAAVALAVAAGTGVVVTAPVAAHTTGIHDNCTSLNKKWPHGVGLRKAVDKGPAPQDRVRNFTKNNKQYRLADRHNGTLDRDNDGIACEKR